MHDGARDAFLYASEVYPGTVVQCSVTEHWKRKVRDTVRALAKNGTEIRELIYCSCHVIQAEADDLRKELRKSGISLDVRDRAYFLSRCEHTDALRRSAETLSRQLVDPLLSDRRVLEHASLALTDEEERVATTYLQLELRARDPNLGLSKLCFESMVTFFLREASPEALHSRAEIHRDVARHVRGADQVRLVASTDGALDRLVQRGAVKHHTKEDAFTLAYAHREEMKERIERLLQNEVAFRDAARAFTMAAASDLGIDYEFPRDAVADDAICLLEHIICETGRLAAVAAVGGGVFSAPKRSVDSVALCLLRSARGRFSSLSSLSEEQFLDLVPVVVERLSCASDASVLERLRTLSDAYCLQFLLQQTSDVQAAIKKMVSGIGLLVDTSVVINAMAEIKMPPEQQRMTRFLRAARAMGCSLIVGDDVLNELDTHLNRIRFNHRNSQIPAAGGISFRRFAAPLLELAYYEAVESGRFGGSFEQYIELFKGSTNPELDLVEYLSQELGIEHRDFSAEVAALPMAEQADLLEQWKLRKRRREWVDEQSFETLALHDTRAFLLVEQQRRKAIASSQYGHQWWWLAIDSAAFFFDRKRHRDAPGSCICMHPDFFAKYMALSRMQSRSDAVAAIPDTALRLASLGLVPRELVEEARHAYETASGEREYLRRRRLRDLMHSAIRNASGREDEQGEAPDRDAADERVVASG